MPQITIAEACELLEANPNIALERVEVDFDVSGQQLSIQAFFVGGESGSDEEVDGEEVDDRFRGTVCDQVFDVDEWRRFGRALRNITLDELHLCR
jgi:extradiol dioxygenase family protein